MSTERIGIGGMKPQNKQFTGRHRPPKTKPKKKEK